MSQGAIKTIISSTFAATIMKIGYGITVQESDDPYVSISEEVLSGNCSSWNSGKLLGRLVSRSEICTKVVSRCRFSKESCALERSNSHYGGKTFRLCGRLIGISSFFESS
jgi:hypothetical protein